MPRENASRGGARRLTAAAEPLLRVATVFDLRPDELLTDVAQPDDQRPLRVAAGTSARPLAIGAHVSPTNVQRWEGGRLERIRPFAEPSEALYLSHAAVGRSELELTRSSAAATALRVLTGRLASPR